MRRLRLNAALVLGALLAALLLIALILPAVVDLGDPDKLLGGMVTNGTNITFVTAPIPPGESGLPLGSDVAGRNLLPRLLLGIRPTLLMGVTILALRTAFAIPIGMYAGWRGGRWGKTVKSFTLGVNALPTLVLMSMALGMIFRIGGVTAQTPRFIIFATVLTLLGIPRLADQVRSLVANVRHRPHVEAAVALGASEWRLVSRHVWPIMRSDMIVVLAAEMAWVLVAMGQLAVIGVYVGDVMTVYPTPVTTFTVEKTPELAIMLNIGRRTLRTHWWTCFYPAVTMGLIIACFQLLAEGVRVRWLRRG